MEQDLLVTRSTPTPRCDQAVCEAIVTAIARLEGVSPLDLPPLAGSIDPDALERLVGSSAADTSSRLQVAFSHAGCDVSVASNGEIVVSHPSSFPPRDEASVLDG